MANLAHFIRRVTTSRAFITGGEIPDFLSPDMHSLFANSILPSSSIIIRDMRDSDIDEMGKLKRFAPVIAIDDCGPGRDLADMAIDLLPNPVNATPRSDLFLYGFTFTESIRDMKKRHVEKTIDVALYCGFHPRPSIIKSLLSFVPKGLTCAILSGPDSLIIEKGRAAPLPISYAETLFASRVLISHFGITLYEGYLAGCTLISVNPTDYHAHLATIAATDIRSTNLGLLHDIDPSEAKETILAAAKNPRTDIKEPRKALEQIELRLDRFYSKIHPFL